MDKEEITSKIMEKDTSATAAAVEHQNEDKKRRNRTVTISIALTVIIVAAVGVVLAFVLRDKNDNEVGKDISQEGRDQVLLNLTFHSVADTMNTQQKAVFSEACTKFYSLNLASLDDVEVSVESQRLQSSPLADFEPDSERMLQDSLTTAPLFGLETILSIVAVVPETQNGTFTAENLVTLATQESSELLYLLTEETDDPYFDFIGSVIAFPLAGSTPTTASIAPSESLQGNESPTVSPSIESTPMPTTTRQLCNGVSSICTRPVNEVLFATMHNANFYRGVALLVPNHGKGIMEGLNAGIRGLQMDVGFCEKDGEPVLSLVNSDCSLGFSDPGTVFTDIHKFLSNNPDEVILMPLKIDETIGGSVGLDRIYSVMGDVVDSDGIPMIDRLYAHPGPGSPWPTMKELIDSDRRIVVFIEDGINECEECIGFQHWESYVVETQTSFDSVDEILNNTENACAGFDETNGVRDFFAVNVFVETANLDASTALNTETFLQKFVETCSLLNGLEPNLLIIDFWEEGDALHFVREYNMALAAPTSAPTPEPSQMPTEKPSQIPTDASMILVPDADGCNGLSNLCHVQVNDMMFAMMHNAHADKGTVPFAPNHNLGIPSGLRFGIRGLHLSFGSCQEQVSLMHASCLAGFSDAVEVLTTIHQFLTDNPREVIIIMADISENTDGNSGAAVDADGIYGVMGQVIDTEGKSLADRLYDHDSNDSWPTLKTMIDLDKRVVMFLRNGANQCERRENCPVGINDAFSWIAETSTGFSNVESVLDDRSGACAIQNGKNGRRDFYAINLFLEYPSEEASKELNNAVFLKEQIDLCSVETGLEANLLNVDFFNQGDVIGVVREYNAALIARSASPTSAPTQQPSPMPSSTPSSLPSSIPSALPTSPTAIPTGMPVAATMSPSRQPTPRPTTRPSTWSPTQGPTPSPTTGSTPTKAPSVTRRTFSPVVRRTSNPAVVSIIP